MKLTDYLSPEFIEIGLEAEDKWDAIRKMIKILARTGNIKDTSALEEEMFTRERTMSTGLGHGVAIPHASSDVVEKISVAAALMKKPIDFESLDLQPVKVIFAIASPKKRGKDYMELLSQIASLFSKREFIEKILNAKTPEDFFKTILDFADK